MIEAVPAPLLSGVALGPVAFVAHHRLTTRSRRAGRHWRGHRDRCRVRALGCLPCTRGALPMASRRSVVCTVPAVVLVAAEGPAAAKATSPTANSAGE